MANYPFVSIIIPTVRTNEILERCLESLAVQDYPKEQFEIILVSLKPFFRKEERGIRTLHGIEFAHARNEGVKASRGELIAFVDDDCVMPKDWLSKAARYFQTSDVGVIGGPALPFKKDAFRYRVGGYLLTSLFVSGFASFRYKIPGKAQEAQEYNLIAANNVLRRKVFEGVGGFDPTQALSEENDLYFRMKQKGYKLLFVPDVFVWHRAKPIWRPLLQKVFFYATGRGILMLRKPNSIRAVYLLPVLFAVGLLLFPVLLLWSPTGFLFTIGVTGYGALNLLNALAILQKGERNVLAIFSVFVATPALHFSYGLGVLYGFYLYRSQGIAKGRKLWRSE